MTANQPQRKREVALDLVRGISALLVMLGHLRSMMFVPYETLNDPTKLNIGFYFATSLGHQMVMVFFVLSGYLVGGPAAARILAGRFNARAYWIARLARLWTVLLPALAATLAIDQLGRFLNPVTYDSALAQFGLSPIDTSDLTTLVGNVFFLQTIAVPTFASNGPLWSLANEFWYYALFPSAVIAAANWPLNSSRLKRTTIHVTALALAVTLLPSALVTYSAIWLMGVAVARIAPRARPSIRRFGSPLSRNIFAASLFGGTLLASQFGIALGSDFAVGASFSVWLLVINEIPIRPRPIRAVAFGLSEISFSLYVLHFPLLLFATSALTPTAKSAPDPYSVLMYAALAGTATIYSALIWSVTERFTPRIRAHAERLIPGAKGWK